jgi:hypothetical protein
MCSSFVHLLSRNDRHTWTTNLPSLCADPCSNWEIKYAECLTDTSVNFCANNSSRDNSDLSSSSQTERTAQGRIVEEELPGEELTVIHQTKSKNQVLEKALSKTPKMLQNLVKYSQNSQNLYLIVVWLYLIRVSLQSKMSPVLYTFYMNVIKMTFTFQ